MAHLLECCGVAREQRQQRSRVITSPSGERVSSYYDLEKLSLPRPRIVRSTDDKLYPVEILGEDQGYYRVHYKGWDHRYDEWRIKDELVEINKSPPGKVEELKLDIKQCLRFTRSDSKVFLRLRMDASEFKPLRQAGIIFKKTRTKTIFTVNCRQSLERLFGVGWDYVVQNKQGDSYFIKTETIRFWLREKKHKTEFIVYPDHLQEVETPQGTELVFSFVKVPGNRAMLHAFLNNSLL